MAVVQTPDGYIWVGSYEGLARFDGVRFSKFDNTNVDGWQDSAVTALFVARNGVLWIGHASGAVSRKVDGHFQTFPPHASWSANRIIRFVEDGAGDVWSQDDLGQMARVRDGLVLTPEPGLALSVNGMVSSLRGEFWILRAGKLSHLINGTLEPAALAPSMEPYIHGMCASSDGGLWVLAADSLWKLQEGRWTRSPEPLQFGGTPVQEMFETSDGRLIGGTTDHGAVFIDPKNRNQDQQLSRAAGFASDWITSICEDQEGGIWLASGTAGLFRLGPKKVTMLAPPDAWQGRAVLSVTVAHDGGYWVGTEGGGLYRLKDAQWTNYAKNAGIRNPYLWSVQEDATGRVWLGTWGGGVYTTNDGETFFRPPGQEAVDSPVTAIVPARRGGIWLGAGRGVALYNGKEPRWLDQGDAARIRNVRTILEDPDGALWIGTNGQGLFHVRNGEVEQLTRGNGLASDFIQCLKRDDAGSLWIGTRGGGLNRLKAGRINIVDTTNGLADGSICHMEDDGLGYYWFSSHNGIFRVSKSELDRCADGQIARVTCLAYGLSDGLTTLAASGALQPAGCKAPDGTLVFATDRGLASIDPKHVKKNTHVPPVVIERVRVDDQVVTENDGVASPIEIQPGRSRIEIKYTALSFAAPEKVQFKRRLEGLDSAWVSVGAERMAMYSYVPPGRYTFHVTAANNDGVWNDAGRTLAIIVLPHFWQTLWFRALVAVGLLVATAWIVRRQTRRRLQRRLDQLERERAIEAERSRIASDMHDDLGAHLTRITMLSETARATMQDQRSVEAGLTMIYETAGNVTKAMDEIVWAVNPKHDTLESLVFYFEKFALDLLHAASLRCRLEFPSEYPSWRPGSEVRHNLFLAYKEALNNAVRHAGADTVTVTLLLHPEGCTLTVADNGRGLREPEDGNGRAPHRIASGNGLKNMLRRMEQVGGTCEVTGALGSGCVVKLFVPVNAPGCSGTIKATGASAS
ncbi:MAG TPA: two-component regulator propeller domain-containing protein [Opitutaceae bacterium]|nr:two-component regulator propeller domain-containing protein [Opitutaceae bacterium]